MFDFSSVVSSVSDVMYSWILVILLIAGGIYFTVRTKAAPVTMLSEQKRVVTEKPKDKEGVSSFQALMVSTASRVGTGNIIGVATAICLGGYGAVFWMWVIALIGGASAFIESTLAQIFKKRSPNGSYGGPAYYIEKGLGLRPLAIIFSVLLILTYGVGFNMLASFNLQSTFSVFDFYNPTATPWIIGGIIALLVAFCLFGGGKRILKITSVLVPVMGILYLLVALLIVLMNFSSLSLVIETIFRDAFHFRAIFGGFASSCLLYGIKRGLFSNEAGVGSAPNAAASADVSHPVKQGLVQTLSVFIDTILICTSTAFMCMCSGVAPAQSADGAAAYVQSAVGASLGEFGPIFITVAMVLFAFTTLIGNLYYVNQGFSHLLGHTPGKVFNYVYYVIACALIFLGAGLSAGLLWDIADILMGLMAIINIPVIVLLGKYALRALKDYRRQRAEGKDPTFRAKDIGLDRDLDYWQ